MAVQNIGKYAPLGNPGITFDFKDALKCVQEEIVKEKFDEAIRLLLMAQEAASHVKDKLGEAHFLEKLDTKDLQKLYINSKESREGIQRLIAEKNEVRESFEMHLLKLLDFASRKNPTCFICFSCGDDEVVEWLKKTFVPDLKKLGIHTIVSFEDLVPGEYLIKFEEKSRYSDLAILICTDELKKKYEEREENPFGSALEIDLTKERIKDPNLKYSTYTVYLKGDRNTACPSPSFELLFDTKFTIFDGIENDKLFDYYSSAFNLFGSMLKVKRRISEKLKEMFIEQTSEILSKKNKIGKEPRGKSFAINTQPLNDPFPSEKKLHNHRTKKTSLREPLRIQEVKQETLKMKEFGELSKEIYAITSNILNDSGLSIIEAIIKPQTKMNWYNKATIEQISFAMSRDFLVGLKEVYIADLNLMISAQCLKNPVIFKRISELHSGSKKLHEDHINFQEDCAIKILQHAWFTQNLMKIMCDSISKFVDSPNDISNDFRKRYTKIVLKEKRAAKKLLEQIISAYEKFLKEFTPLKNNIDLCLNEITQASIEEVKNDSKKRNSLNIAINAINTLSTAIYIKQSKAEIQINIIKTKIKGSVTRRCISNVLDKAIFFLEEIRDKLLNEHAIWVQSKKQCHLMQKVGAKVSQYNLRISGTAELNNAKEELNSLLYNKIELIMITNDEFYKENKRY